MGIDIESVHRWRVTHRTHRAGGIGGVVVATLLLLLVICVAVAFAEDSAPESARGPTLEEIRAAPDSGAAKVLFPDTDSQAAAELPHEDLTRDQANDLLSGVFGPVLPDPSIIPSDVEVKRFYGDNVALVVDAEGGGNPALLESTLPLKAEDRSGDEDSLNLGLEKVAGELRPSSPLVDVGIPMDLGDGLSLPESDIEVALAGAPDGVSPSTIQESIATYPNVADDTLFAIAPTPTGVETFTLLQSPDAPLTQTFDLALPLRSTLHGTDEGGALVRDGDRVLARILPPTAIDAAGDPVEVRLQVSGDSFTLSTTPSSHTKYPVLVDPIFETYSWHYDGTVTGIGSDWREYTNHTSFNAYATNYCYPDGHPCTGLVLSSGTSWIPAGTQASWSYYVPRWFTDYFDPSVKARPTTFINKATLWNLHFQVYPPPYPESVHTDPFMQMYLWDANNGFVANGRRLGTEGSLTDMNYQYNLVNPNENVGAKQLSIELVSTQNQTSQYRTLYMGHATIELTDKDSPTFGSLGSPSQWLNDKPSTSIPFSLADPGLGIHHVTVAQPEAAKPNRIVETKDNLGCTGVVRKPCRRTWNSSVSNMPQINYDPSTMPQGENWVQIRAYDPIGRTSAPGQVRVKVDHTAPRLELAGTLTEQEEIGPRTNYGLQYTAADGFEATPAAVSATSLVGTGESKPPGPRGIATDGKGNVWVVDRENCRVVKFDESGKHLGQLGSCGTANGQFQDPRGVAIAPDGTIWVTDAARGRIQRFSSQGSYLNGFGVKAASPSSDPYAFVNAYGIAVSSTGTIWVTDSVANRVARFAPTNEEGKTVFVANALGAPSSGTAKAELSGPVALATDEQGNVWVAEHTANRVSVFDADGKFRMRFGSLGSANGQFKGPAGIAVMPSGRLLVADDGNGRMQEFLSDGSYFRQFATAGTASNQLQEPRGVAIGKGNVAFVADAGNRRFTRWIGVDTDPQSGVVSTEVRIDGNPVEPKHSPGCATLNCSITREWTINANDYASGQHRVEVTATDGVGLSKTEGFLITTDQTPPELQSLSTYFQTPKGWLEQKPYSYSVTFNDSSYGVELLVYKIDGQVVDAMSQSCPDGSCAATLSGAIDMTAYEGGAHSAELIATDAAGNVKAVKKTINVAPEGHVSPAEAENTLEAVDATGEINTVGPAQSEAGYPGTADGLTIDAGEWTDFVADGSAAPVSIGSQPGTDISVEIPRPEVLESSCTEAPFEEKEEMSAAEEAALAQNPQFSSCSEASTAPEFVSIEVAPNAVAAEASNPVVTAEGSAVIAPNVVNHVDLITRPLYDGAMTFAAIRDANAPESFSWTVKLEEGQELKLVDSTHAAVYYAEGSQAFGINAVPAHDAVGTTVPTTLSVSGDVLTLTVDHKPTISRKFVYPVVAGAGWQGGFQTYSVAMPPPAEEQGGEEAAQLVDGIVEIMTFGPPRAGAQTSATESLAPYALRPEERKFKFTYCMPKEIPGSHGVREIPPFDWDVRLQYPGVISDCSNPDLEGIYWMVTAHGWYHYKAHHWVWITGFDSGWCDKYGEEQPAKVYCKARRNEPGQGAANAVHGPIRIIGQYRFHPGKGHWEVYTRAVCLTLGGKLYPRAPLAATGTVERPLIRYWHTVAPPEKCEWKE